jgi:predicted Zn-ribbon and HTH transcriptional regulator
MKIKQNYPTFGMDTDDIPAAEYRKTVPGIERYVAEMERRKIKPEAIITQDDGKIIKIWFWGMDIIAYRHNMGEFDVVAAYTNTVRPHMIPDDLDIILASILKGTGLEPTIILPILKCLRCGYTWPPRSEAFPKVCPNPECKSPYWNKPRKK